MKRIFLLTLVIILLVSFSSCADKKTDETIKITQDNITDYVNVQLVFGNVEQIIYEPEEENSSSIIFPPLQNSDRYLSCICYIYVTPKADYKFENASLTFTISDPDKYSSGLFESSSWTIDPGKITKVVSIEVWEKTIYLDKNGYGVTSVRFKKSGDSGHPLSIGEDWEADIKGASGSVIN